MRIKSGIQGRELPVASLPAELHLNLQSVGYAADEEYLAPALDIILAINDVINHACRHLRRKGEPGVGRDDPLYLLEIVVGVRPRKGHGVMQTLNLENRVGSETTIESQEGGIGCFAEMLVSDGC